VSAWSTNVSDAPPRRSLGPEDVRADAGFWSWKLIDRLNVHGIAWSITVTRHAAVALVIEAIPEAVWGGIN
jgi:hypothetical protein